MSSSTFGRTLRLLILLPLVALLNSAQSCAEEEFMPDWKQVDRLVEEQKFEAAAGLALEILGAARKRGAEADITRALIRSTQLRLALHGYETGVRFLREEPWPQQPRHRLVLQLFYGHSLHTYLRANSWEIAQREEILGSAGEGLETWTGERIEEEIHRAYLGAFKQRDEWGTEAVGELSAYLEENDYPPRVRGTLRDVVCYLWVDLLADTGRWRPEASNELYRLDLEALVAEAESFAGEPGQLGDPEVHPLRKIRFVLADLEAWHSSRRQPEAALEARLELLRRLMGSFSSYQDDRQVLRADLEKRLAAFDRGLPWWSMGQALLAEMWRNESEDPNHLVKAREIAREGAAVHAGSVGTQRCQHLVATLEQAQIQVAAMAVDGAERRSIEVTHANVDRVFFRAYRVPPLSGLDQKGRRLHPDRQEVERLVAAGEISAAWSVELPPTPDLQLHRTFVTPPLPDPGAYVIASSLREDFRSGGNARNALYFLRSDLVLISRALPDERSWEITARSAVDGLPRQVEIEVHRLDWQRGHGVVGRHPTDAAGILVLGAKDWRGRSHVLVARSGEHLAIAQLYGQPQGGREPAQRSTLIYTDRSVYRPGQEVLYKIVAYEGQGGRLRTVPKAKVTVELKDANFESVASEEVVTNAFGSASGRFTATAGRLLGGWSLVTSWGGRSSIEVEEYKRPTFEVAITAPTGALRLNKPVTLTGQADYYFGLPVSAGKARWRVSREPVFPPWRWWRPMPVAPPRVIAHGEAELAADGSFEVTFVPEADPRSSEDDREISYRYRLSAEVTDEGGETRSGSRAVRIGFVAVEASLEAAEPFTASGRGTAVEISRKRLDGAPAAGLARYRVTRLEQPATTPLPADLPLLEERLQEAYRTAGDALRPRWQVDVDPRTVLRSWGDGEEIEAGELKHGEDGTAALVLQLPAGAFRLHYSTKDDFGAEIERQLELLVAGEDSLSMPALLLPAAATVEPGGTASFLVHAGFSEQTMLFEVFRGDKRLERRVLTAGPAPQIVDIPVGMDDRGGFGVSLTVLRDHQLMRLQESVEVPWVDRRLEVAFERFRDKLTPGDRETFTVTVKGRAEDGDMDATVDPATLELVAYMYDRSLDLFAEHAPPEPMSLYPRWRSVPSVQSTLGMAPMLWHLHKLPQPPRYPHLRSARLRFFDGWPIGGPGVRRLDRMSMSASPPSPMALKARPVADAALQATASPQAAAEGAAPAQEAYDAVGVQPPGGADAEQASDQPVRSDFAETAFWMPHLRLGKDGAARLEFTVPDSVTEWSVWAHALSQDLRSGSVEKRTRSAKDLLIRPYLPRFLREGDRAELRMVISNAGDTELSGTVEVTLEDPDSGADLRAELGLDRSQTQDLPFTVGAGGTTTLTLPLVAPQRPRPVAVTAWARAGELVDGERRPLPILPSRLYLAQSRFAALRGPATRTLRFADLAAEDDPSRTTDSLIVTLDGQLFGSVLRALPYLVEYPYQCVEQNLNRYLSTGILSRLYDEHPSVATLAARLAEERDRPLEIWDRPDPNRMLLLEETPWLRHARGGDDIEGLLKVLDPKVAAEVRAKALGELRNAQTSSGGFPWWPGGPPSPYMTLYVLQGFSRALEFGLEVPKEVVVRAWSYLADYWRRELEGKLEEQDCCAEQLTFFSWLVWAYPDSTWTGDVFTDDERRRIVALAERRWKELSPRLKGYLALALERSGRSEDAHRVWESVMDSAKTDENLGTYWAPEARAWLWYNDTVETHAFALRVLMALDPEDARRHGLAQWLLLDKKLGHWKSTRATAEALYGLAAYLEGEGSLGERESVAVAAGAVRESYVLEPDEDGRRQLVIEGSRVDSSMAEIEVSTSSKSFLFASATWHFATDRLPHEARGDFFHVERSYFRRVLEGDAWVLQPLAEGASITVGDQVEVRLVIGAKHAAEYVHLRDPRGAGFEPEDTDSGWSWQTGVGHYREIRDSATNFFFEWLPVGEYTFRYRLRATTAGTFRVGPAQLQSMYAPEFVAYSAGREVAIAP